MNHPNPKLHLYVSLLKSAVRIAAAMSLVTSDFIVSGTMFLAAEILGIMEELV